MVLQTTIDTITHAIGLAVAPVFLLTAIATLIGTLNNRLGRIIDRRRVVLARGGKQCEDETMSNATELALLSQRARLVYLAVLFAVLSALMVCLVVSCAFFGVLFTVVLSDLLAGFFVLAMLSLILSLSLFLREVFVAVFTATHANRQPADERRPGRLQAGPTGVVNRCSHEESIDGHQHPVRRQ